MPLRKPPKTLGPATLEQLAPSGLVAGAGRTLKRWMAGVRQLGAWPSSGQDRHAEVVGSLNGWAPHLIEKRATAARSRSSRAMPQRVTLKHTGPSSAAVRCRL